MEARKNIEKKMEQFKNCEKEAKTKAFSKAGLDQAAKLDPEEKARQSTRDWLNEQMETLQMQVRSHISLFCYTFVHRSMNLNLSWKR